MPLLLCPNCQIGMREVERNGVHIDVCPQCRGVWLDRGELERLLEPVRQAHAAYDEPRPSAPPPPQPYPQHQPPPYPQHQGQHQGHGHGYGHQTHHPYKKKKSPWSDMLDIFD